jgi:outer membrane receptor protein involved in Fe transport
MSHGGDLQKDTMTTARATALATLALTLGAAGAVQAQEGANKRPVGEDAAAAGVQEVIVTGSRLQIEGMTTPTPVTALTADALADIAPGNVAQAMDQLPQFYNNSKPQTAGAISGPLGANAINMRGLGLNRTLVLLDGRRVVPFNRLGAVDISSFPQALVKRVDVVTGGASAAYGTDAVAGVVNFLLNQDFKGFDARVQGGNSDLTDYGQGQASLAYGTNLGDRMHLIASVDYNQSAEIKSYSDRDWFQAWSLVTDPSNPSMLMPAPNIVSTAYTCGGLIVSPNAAINNLEFLSDGTTRPFQRSQLSSTTGSRTQSIAPQYGGGSGCNPSTLANRVGGGSLVPSQERGSAFTHLTFELTDNVSLFGQVLYGHNRVSGNGNSATMSGTYQGTIFRGNPYLPQNVQDAMVANNIASFNLARWNADIDNGRLFQTNDTLMFTGGFDAKIARDGFFNDWHINGYYDWGKNKNRQTIRNFIRVDRLYQALDAVRDPATGNIVCNAALLSPALYGDCVPLNLFGENRASQAAIDYVEGPDRTTKADVTERVVELSASGRLFEGWGSGPISGAFGASYRDDKLDQTMDPASITSLAVPQNNAALGIRGTPAYFTNRPNQVYQFAGAYPLAGSTSVREVFTEALVPLVSEKPGVESLNLNLAGRYAWYSGSGGIPSYKAGLDWQIYNDVRLRGTYSRDVRAANLAERFDTQLVGATVRDPVNGGQTTGIGTISGGNPDVKPETADTMTAGLVYQPSWLQGFSASVDWYDVEVKGAIGQLATQTIVDGCFAGSAQYCSYIQRDPVTNLITQIYAAYLNINKENVSGIDVELDYQHPIKLFGDGNETLGARLFYTYLKERSFSDPGAPKDDQTGDMTLGYPQNRIMASINYTLGSFRMFLQERFIGSGILDHTLTNVTDNHVDSVLYTDARFVYALPTSDSNWEAYLNVTNVFDKTPPIIVGTCCGLGGTSQTNVGLYDVIGRQYILGVHVKL